MNEWKSLEHSVVHLSLVTFGMYTNANKTIKVNLSCSHFRPKLCARHKYCSLAKSTKKKKKYEFFL